MPDRLVLLLNGILTFVELKAPGKKFRPLQIRRKAQLELFVGLVVFMILTMLDSRKKDKK